MAGEFFVWYVPLGGVLVFNQPCGDLLRSPLVMDFSDKQRALPRKKRFRPTQDFILTTFHVNLQQLWRGSPAATKSSSVTAGTFMTSPLPSTGRFPSASTPPCDLDGAPTKRDSIDSGMRPYFSVHHPQAIP